MSCTVDANVLIYATNQRDPVHEKARELVESLAAGPDLVYLFWPTLLGYLRIVTRTGALRNPLAPREATENVGELLARPNVRAPGEAAGFWELYTRTADPNTRGNLVPDAHLATLMRQHGVRLIYTRDRGFRRFEGIDARDPFAV